MLWNIWSSVHLHMHHKNITLILISALQTLYVNVIFFICLLDVNIWTFHLYSVMQNNLKELATIRWSYFSIIEIINFGINECKHRISYVHQHTEMPMHLSNYFAPNSVSFVFDALYFVLNCWKKAQPKLKTHVK